MLQCEAACKRKDEVEPNHQGSTDDEPEANILQGRWVSGSEPQPEHDGAWGKKVSAAAA